MENNEIVMHRDDAADIMERSISQLESVAYLVESIGVNIAHNGTPSDRNLVESACAHLDRELTDLKLRFELVYEWILRNESNEDDN